MRLPLPLMGLPLVLAAPVQASDARPTPALQDTGPTLTLVAPSLEAPGGQQGSAWALTGLEQSAVAGTVAWTPTRRARLHLGGVATAAPTLDGTDLTLGGTVALLQAPRQGLDLAIVPELTWNPRLGSVQSFAGRLAVVAGGRTPTLGWTASAGAAADTGQDAWAEGGVALRTRLFTSSWLVGEVRGGWGLLGDTQGLQPVDGAVGLAVRASGRATALVFTEVTVDPGTLAWSWRLALGIRARRTGLPPDVDRDHVSNRSDLCIRTAEDIDGNQDLDGCPEFDDDGDGLADDKDLCPQDAEDLDGHADTDGCPDPDNDQDGVLEPDDQCPDLPGRPELGGCPDGDGDTIVDSLDQCPARKGTPLAQGCPDWDGDGVPEPRDQCPQDPASGAAVQAVSDGCPTALSLSGAHVRLLDVVLFEGDTDTLSAAAGPAVSELGRLLRARPGLHLVVDPGDATGRGEAVRAALVAAGGLPPGQVSVAASPDPDAPWVNQDVDLLVLALP